MSLAPDPADIAACEALLARGSKSFALASRLLPARVRGPVAALYAFCRVADDAVDGDGDPGAQGQRVALPAGEPAVAMLRSRLDRAAAGYPLDQPVDRAFSATLLTSDLPRALPDALLDGMAWDAHGRRYRTLDELVGYCARVASSVGVMMTVMLGQRDPSVLARAADLGVAMQLTNIARDVGEDLARGRIYLPTAWLASEGINPDALLARPAHSAALGRVVARLLDAADAHYRAAEEGLPWLPWDARVAIRAAALIYADIGREVRAAGCDSMTRRAHTSTGRKLVLAARAFGVLFWRRRRCDSPPHPAVAFLVDAAAPVQRKPAATA